MAATYVSLGFISSGTATDPLVDFWQTTLERLPALGVGLGIFLGCALLAGPISRLAIRPFGTLTQSSLIRSVVRRSISILIVLLGLYLFLQLAGLTGFAVAVVSGTGVVGIILGFAFRDIAENFISSLLLTVQRPFRLKDVVQIDEHVGVVQKVTARATTLVDFDGNHIQIPNAAIYKGTIKNLTANPNMRGHFIVGVGYDSDVRQAQRLAMAILRDQAEVLDEPEPQVLIDNLGASCLNLKIYFWVNAEQNSLLKMASMLMRKVVETFTAQGISMPDDAREIIFPQGVPVVQAGSSAADQQASSRQEDALPSDRDVNQSKIEHRKPAVEDNEDVSSENDTIRHQAAQARDPDAGQNIL